MSRSRSSAPTARSARCALPIYTFEDLAYGELSEELLVSPRIAPIVAGSGLLEAIPDDAISAAADPDDEDGDGISGRVNMVWDARAEELRIGRFGWKANVPTLEQQTAAAFLGDIGITSPLFPTPAARRRASCHDARRVANLRSTSRPSAISSPTGDDPIGMSGRDA